MPRKKEELAGKIFGRWKVIEECSSKGSPRKWLVECLCENKTRKIVFGDFLKRGLSKSCGCLRREMLSKRFKRDLKGLIIDHLKVIEKRGKDKDGRILWLVECPCEKRTQKVVTAERLLTGNARFCECLPKRNRSRKYKPRVKDHEMINKTFGRLKVLRREKNDEWLTECDCGKEKIVGGRSLRNGTTRSCGCLKSMRKNLIGQLFGRWKVIEKSGSGKKESLWLVECQCKDKTRKIINCSSLTTGNSKSCGCLKLEMNAAWCRSRCGAKNHNWNPNREIVELRKLIHDRCKAMLQTCIKKTKQKKIGKTETMLGYSRNDLLERLTSHPDWEKICKDRWHIDHIFPIKAFVDHGITDMKIINSLSNLQPMNGSENIRKSGKYDKNLFYEYLKSKGIADFNELPNSQRCI